MILWAIHADLMLHKNYCCAMLFLNQIGKFHEIVAKRIDLVIAGGNNFRLTPFCASTDAESNNIDTLNVSATSTPNNFEAPLRITNSGLVSDEANNENAENSTIATSSLHSVRLPNNHNNLQNFDINNENNENSSSSLPHANNADNS